MYNLTSISNLSLLSRYTNSAQRVFRLIRLVFCLMLLATLGISHATAAVYEPFDYTTGSFANGTAVTGSGLSGKWTNGASGAVVSGLTYTGLPVANNALESSGARQFASLASPISNGTQWVSFLFKTSSGNPGAVINGVYFPNGGTGLWFGFGLNPYSPTQGYLGLGSMNTVGTAAQSATSLTPLGLGTYGNTYLVVLKIEFNTSGNYDTVTVYLNPVANQEEPGVAVAGTSSAFDVGTISGVGLNVTANATITVDEIRVGDTYADAIAAVTAPPDAPTGLNATAGTNLVSLSWTAAAGIPSSYNVKRSSSSGGPYTNIIATTTVPTVTYDDAVIGGQTYYYVVSAVNVIGEGADSAYVAVSPILAAPDAPAGLSVTPGNAQVSLSWSASTFATSYDVKRATDINGPYDYIGTTTAPEVTYDDTDGLSNATTYYYVVAATGAGGSSFDSSPVSATPFGPMPLVATIDSGLGLIWFASNSVTYQVQWASEDLGTNTVWNNLGESISGNGETNTMFDPVGEPHNYYRVLSIEY
jgi:fibronectin type 3 domain-containing protein